MLKVKIFINFYLNPFKDNADAWINRIVKSRAISSSISAPIASCLYNLKYDLPDWLSDACSKENLQAIILSSTILSVSDCDQH